jgi:hypothetical protein
MKHSNDPTWKRVDQMTPEEYRERYEALIAEGIKPDPNGLGGRRRGGGDGGIILCHHTHCGSKSCGFCKGRGVIYAVKDSLAHRTHCAKMSVAPKKVDVSTSWTPAAELQEMGKEEFKREILGGFPEPVKYNTQEFRQRIADQISAEIASGVFNVGEIPYSNGTQVLYTYYGPKAITTSTSTDIKLKEKEMNKSNDSEAKPVSVATQQRVMKVAETIDTIVDDTKSASVRAAASQFVKLTREPLVAALTRVQTVVMDTHRAHPNGLTDQELRRHLPQFDGGSLVKRRSELARAGLVFDTGTTRETASGRRAIVWRVTL